MRIPRPTAGAGYKLRILLPPHSEILEPVVDNLSA
jgi:hypothetical protein